MLGIMLGTNTYLGGSALYMDPPPPDHFLEEGWDSAAADPALFTFSSLDTIVARISDPTWATVFSKHAMPSTADLIYTEITVITLNSGDNDFAIGCADDNTGTGIILGNPSNSWGYRPSGEVINNEVVLTTLTSYADAIIGVAINIRTGKGWFRNDGDWMGGDPSADTGEHFTFTPTTPMYLGCTMSTAGDKIDGNFGQQLLIGEIPLGALPWVEQLAPVGFEFVGASAAAAFSAGNVTPNITTVAGRAEGDLLVGCVGYRGEPDFTPPSGWSFDDVSENGNILASPDASSALRQDFIRLGASDPDVTWVRLAGDVAIVAVPIYRHADEFDLSEARTAISKTADNLPDVTITSGVNADRKGLYVVAFACGDNNIINIHEAHLILRGNTYTTRFANVAADTDHPGPGFIMRQRRFLSSTLGTDTSLGIYDFLQPRLALLERMDDAFNPADVYDIEVFAGPGDSIEHHTMGITTFVPNVP